MRRPVLSLGLVALTLCSALPLSAADAPAAASSAAPTPVTAAAAPSASTQPAPSAATAAAATAPAASTLPAAASAATPAQAEAPAPAAAQTPASTQTVQTMPAPTTPSTGISMPIRGMDMANVEHIFGTPLQKYDAVGKPPITRWDYPSYVVYFEYNMVLHTVVKSGG